MEILRLLEKSRELLNEWKSSLLIGLASAIFIVIFTFIFPIFSRSEWFIPALIIAYAILSLSIASFIVKIINFIYTNRIQKKLILEREENLARLKEQQINTAKLILNEMTTPQKEILWKLLSGPAKFDSYSYHRNSMREDLRFLQTHNFIDLITQLSSSKAIFELNELFTDIISTKQRNEIASNTDKLLSNFKDEISTLLNNFIPKKPKIKLPKSILTERFKFEPALSFYWNNSELTIKFNPHYKKIFENRLDVELDESAIYELIEIE